MFFFRVAFITFKTEADANIHKKCLLGKVINECKIEKVDYMGAKSENERHRQAATTVNGESECMVAVL